MTTIPKPADLTAGFSATYDAFSRLVKLADGMNTVAEYEYDGLNRRILKKTYVEGELDETRDFYFSEDWQVVEERVDGGSTAERQYVWGTTYIDDLILRDRDADANTENGLEERLYATHDALYSVTTLANASGTVQERFAYTPYGQSLVLDSNFTMDADSLSDFDWDTRFTGRLFDVESHLNYYRARFVHSAVGTFVSRDPSTFASPLAFYQYSGSNPINNVDPTGHLPLATCRKRLFGVEIHVQQILTHYSPYHCSQIKEVIDLFRTGGCKIWIEHKYGRRGADAIEFLEFFLNQRCFPPDKPKPKYDRIPIPVTRTCPDYCENPDPDRIKEYLVMSGLVAAGTAIIIIDIVTVPSGEGACGVLLIRYAVAGG